jgi:hypothetical protein
MDASGVRAGFTYGIGMPETGNWSRRIRRACEMYDVHCCYHPTACDAPGIMLIGPIAFNQIL